MSTIIQYRMEKRSVQEILEKMQVFPEVQRNLSQGRAKSLANYLDQGISGNRKVFLPAFIVNERSPLIWSVNDGQHRYAAIKLLEEQYRKDIEKAVKKNTSARSTEEERLDAIGKQAEISAKRSILLNMELGIQVYEGLSAEDERQLFADVNVNVSKPPMSLGASFDTASVLARVLSDLLVNLPALDAEVDRTSTKLTDKLALFTTVRKSVEILLGKSLNEDDVPVYVSRVTTMFSIYMENLPDDAKSEEYFYTYASNMFAVARYTRDLLDLADQGVSWEKTLKATLSRVKMEHSNPLFHTIGNVPVDNNSGKLVFTGTGSAVPAILNVLRACTKFVGGTGKTIQAQFKRSVRSASQEVEDIAEENGSPTQVPSGEQVDVNLTSTQDPTDQLM